MTQDSERRPEMSSDEAKANDELTHSPDNAHTQLPDIPLDNKEKEIESITAELTTLCSDQNSSDNPTIQPHLLGDFSDYPVSDMKITIPSHLGSEVTKSAADLAARRRWSMPSLLKGDPTATEYAARASNFSTRTSIASLSDGSRIFVVYTPRSRDIHVELDGFYKEHSGKPMKKVPRSDWKSTFESKSRIPVIPNEYPFTVTMPFIPNVNAKDAIKYNHEIEDFGECEWAKDLDYDDKLTIAQDITGEIADIHQSGIAWGGVLLNNIIIASTRQPIIVDPETRYRSDVPLREQQAYDLHDFLMSFGGALHASEHTTDYSELVRTVLDSYPDDAVVEVLQRVAGSRPGIVEQMFRKYYETQRISLPFEEMNRINDTIVHA